MEGPHGDKRLCLPGDQSQAVTGMELKPKGWQSCPPVVQPAKLTWSPGHFFRPLWAQCGLWKAGSYLEARARLGARTPQKTSCSDNQTLSHLANKSVTPGPPRH